MSKKPNIVVLMSDQQRLDTVSAYGLNDICKTPNIDALAARGTRFDAAFTPTAICSPARASFTPGSTHTNTALRATACVSKRTCAASTTI